MQLEVTVATSPLCGGGRGGAEVTEETMGLVSWGLSREEQKGIYVRIMGGGVFVETRGIQNKSRWKVQDAREREKEVFLGKHLSYLSKQWGRSSVSRWTASIV